MDTITEICIRKNNGHIWVYIKISDGGVMQLGLDEQGIAKLKEQIFFMPGATIVEYKNDTKKGHVCLDYKVCDRLLVNGKGRLEFRYDSKLK